MHILLKELLNAEGKFRDRKNQVHLFDVPMFSVFADEDLPKKHLYNIKRGEKRIKGAFEKARQEIHSLGFASMHSNVIIKDLSQHHNQNTGGIGVGGWATPKGKYMAISISSLKSGSEDGLAKLIVHEWAHLWMFNNSKEFKTSVKLLYDKMLKSGASNPKMGDVSAKLPPDIEKFIINEWADAIYSVFKNEKISSYIFNNSNNPITGLKFAPFGISISVILKKPLDVFYFNREHAELSPGEQVYIQKGHTNWIIGNEKNGRRRETVMNTLDMLNHVKSRNENETVFDAVKFYSGNVHGEFAPRKLDIYKFVYESMVKKFIDICKSKKFNPDNEIISSVESMAKKYIARKIIEITDDEEMYNEIYEKPLDQIYDFIWLSNEEKPNDVSITSIFRKMYNKQAISYSANLSGIDNEPYRKYLQSLYNWVNSYGMSNDEELWATGIEHFFKLPLPHRKAIIKLMMNMGAS